MYDPRSVANFIISECSDDGVFITNITLQKLVYFCHAFFLLEHKEPLVSGYFEAWKYGPVHPTLYKAFKKFGANPITEIAQGYNYLENSAVPLPTIEELRARRTIKSVLSRLGSMSAGQLIDLTHAKNGPWHFVVESSKQNANLGLRIADDVTVERLKFMKLAVGGPPKVGDPDEDTPFSGD